MRIGTLHLRTAFSYLLVRLARCVLLWLPHGRILRRSTAHFVATVVFLPALASFQALRQFTVAELAGAILRRLGVVASGTPAVGPRFLFWFLKCGARSSCGVAREVFIRCKSKARAAGYPAERSGVPGWWVGAPLHTSLARPLCQIRARKGRIPSGKRVPFALFGHRGRDFVSVEGGPHPPPRTVTPAFEIPTARWVGLLESRLLMTILFVLPSGR